MFTGYFLLCLVGQTCSYDHNLMRISGPFQYGTFNECVDSLMGITAQSSMLERLNDQARLVSNPDYAGKVHASVECGDRNL